jgi:hypothetical protein
MRVAMDENAQCHETHDSVPIPINPLLCPPSRRTRASSGTSSFPTAPSLVTSVPNAREAEGGQCWEMESADSHTRDIGLRCACTNSAISPWARDPPVGTEIAVDDAYKIVSVGSLVSRLFSFTLCTLTICLRLKSGIFSPFLPIWVGGP